MVSYDRVAEIIRQDREPLTEGLRDLPQPLRGEVVFDDVGFAYNTEADVLHHISFRVEPGQSVALLGSTGSGKTSLVNLLPRFYEYTSGKLTLDGIDLKDISREYSARQNRHCRAGTVPVLAHDPRKYQLRRQRAK